MKTVTVLRDELATVFDQLMAGEIKAKDAGELANIAGKMINSAKVQLEYHALRKTTPKISFLD